MIILKDSFLGGGKNRARFKPWLVKKQQSFNMVRIGSCSHQFCSLDNIRVMFVFRCDYGGLLILS